VQLFGNAAMDRQTDTQKDTQTAVANIHFASANVMTDTTLSLFLLLLKVIAVCVVAWGVLRCTFL